MIEIRSLSLADEIPLKELPPSLEGSENYCLWGYDFDHDVGFFSHIGRWSLDRSMWREQFYLFMPNRQVLVHRGVSASDTATGPRGPLLSHTCDRPGEKWTLRFRGPAMRYESAELVGRFPNDKPVELVDFNVRFTGHRPAFFYPGSDNSIWGHYHYEQHGRIEGTVDVGAETHRICGYSFRDHTRGLRNLSHFVGANWIQGELPDGTGFALFEVWTQTDHGVKHLLRELTLVLPDRVEVAKLIESPSLESLDVLDAPQGIVFDYSGGRVEIVGQPRNTMMFSVYGRHEILFGTARGPAPIVVAEQPLELLVNGTRSYGYAERARRLSTDSPKLGFAGTSI